MAINTACIPKVGDDEHGDRRWMNMHERFIKDTKRYEPNVVCIGDSLIERMQHTPIWKQFFEPLHTLNFGISCDKTQNLLWRIQNGELDNIKPKAIILLIGTNNYENSGEQIGEAIIEIIKQIKQKQAKTHLIVLGIPPRGREISRVRDKIDCINKIVENYCKLSKDVDPYLTYLCCNSLDFISTVDGTISHHDMFDYLHFTNDGYRKFCEPIIEELQNILNLEKD